MIEEGFHKVPLGHVATVVTYLEMTSPAALRPAELPEGVTLRRVTDPDTVWYKDLFMRVGGQDWLWFSRLKMENSKLGAIIRGPDVHIFTLDIDGTAQAILELDFREKDKCEVAFFGVAPALTGSTAGRCLMNHAITYAFAQGIDMLHLHTCTLDHPRALAFYRRTGFTPVRQEIEVLEDPRLTGDLPKEAAPHIPIFA